MSERKEFELGDFVLQSGRMIPGAKLAYATFGTLAPDKSNLILYPTSYGVTDAETRWVIGKGGILNPEKYFIVIPNMLGNSASTSPSNFKESYPGDDIPRFTHVDNVKAQRRLLDEVFGIEKIALIYGWSMGAQQALQWGALHPEMVERICAMCGTAKTTPHNALFLEGLRAALCADAAFQNGWFVEHPERGLRAMARVYAGWALSQAFYRERGYELIGFATREDYVLGAWEEVFIKRKPDDLVSMIETWLTNDISNNDRFNGDLDAALAAITARTSMIASNTDLYFTSHDMRENAARIANAQFFELASTWGHRAGNPEGNPADTAALKGHVEALLQE